MNEKTEVLLQQLEQGVKDVFTKSAVKPLALAMGI